MRILYYTTEFPSLSQTFVLAQIKGMLDKNLVVDVLSKNTGQGVQFNDPSVNPLGDKVMYFPNIKGLFIERQFKKAIYVLRKLMRNRKLIDLINPIKYGRDAISLNLAVEGITFYELGSYDILHCQFGMLGKSAILLRNLGLVNGKIVISFRGYDLPKFLKQKRPDLYQELFRSADLLLPVCEYFMHRMIELGCNHNKILVHRSGVNTEQLHFSERKLCESEELRLLVVGRMVEKKGFKYAIKGLALAKRIIPLTIDLRVVGDGPLRADLETLVSELGLTDSVVFTGTKRHAEVIQEMTNAHILLAPSVTTADGDQEGIPNVLKEAMATGLPVIATRHSGIPELVEDGVSGLLIEEKDITGIAEAIGKLINWQDRWGEMGKAGREMVLRDYNSAMLNEQLYGIYRSLVKK